MATETQMSGCQGLGVEGLLHKDIGREYQRSWDHGVYWLWLSLPKSIPASKLKELTIFLYAHFIFYYFLTFSSLPADTFFIAFRERGSERERERNIDVREKHQLVASICTPTGDRSPNLDMPWPGIELVTFWFAGDAPANWATPARACILTLKKS